MPYNGVGTFTSLGAPTFPAVPNTYILASYFNATMNDIFTGLSSVMTKDGQSSMAANLPMGGFKITGLANGVNSDDAVTYLQVFDSPTIANPTFTGVPTAPTAAPGTSTTQLANTAFVMTQAFNSALPGQAGNAGKFVTTDGGTASWSSLKTVGLNSISGSGDIPLNYPAQLITASTVTATSGQCLALTNATAQAAINQYIRQTDQIGNASTWILTGCTLTPNAAMAPDGSNSASLLTNSAGTLSLVMQVPGGITPSSTNDYYVSVYVKKGTASKITLNAYYTGDPEDNLKVDLTNMTVTGVPYSGEYALQYVGGGWYRVGYRITRNSSGTATSLNFRVWLNARVGGAVGETVYLWGAMLENSATMSSYFPNPSTSQPVARSAGVVAPQRVVLPASPAADAWVKTVVANGITTNVIDPNGSTIMGQSGPMTIDSVTTVTLQYINGSWRLI